MIKECPECKAKTGGCQYCNWTGTVYSGKFRLVCGWCQDAGCSKCGNYPPM